MTALHRYVVSFSDISKDDIALVGGKGANLGEMMKMHLPVPDGFIVTSLAYYQFLKENNLQTIIKNLLTSTDFNKTTSLEQTSKHIKKYSMQGILSEDLVQEVFQAYKR